MENEQYVKIPGDYVGNVFGSFDENIKALEKKFAVSVINRGDDIIVAGEPEAVAKASEVLQKLTEIAAGGEVISLQHVNYLSSLSDEEAKIDVTELMSDVVCFTRQGKPIRPKTLGQKRYVDLIRKDMLTFGVGPAGTGKTYLAMAMAIQAFKSGEINRIILTRPAIEAGNASGFCREICKARSIPISGRYTTLCMRSWGRRALPKIWRREPLR